MRSTVELNWTTFILEILNFLVLVWLLKRLFYRPVQEMIEKRRKGIEQQFENSRKIQERAENLQNQYEYRLEEWESERQAARSNLENELAKESRRLFDKLQDELEAERKKQEVLTERQVKEQLEKAEIRALELGARFAASVLKELRAEQLEARIIDLLLRQLGEISGEKLNGLATVSEQGRQQEVYIVSAYPLNRIQQQKLEECLQKLLSAPLALSFSEDDELIAGLRMTIGPWVIRANLKDELKTFADMARISGKHFV